MKILDILESVPVVNVINTSLPNMFSKKKNKPKAYKLKKGVYGTNGFITGSPGEGSESSGDGGDGGGP